MSDDQPALARAFNWLANGLLNTKRTQTFARVREPNPFDGSDTQKLQPFLTQCFLNFQDQPDAFADDSGKVTYTLSYLKGTALDCFEPSLTSGNDISWLSDYSKFVSKLHIHFGPFDPEGEAEAELENLCMHDNQRITKYLVEFDRLAARVQWENAALRCQFYNGLLPQIKDGISRFGKPDNLQELRTLSVKCWDSNSMGTKGGTSRRDWS